MARQEAQSKLLYYPTSEQVVDLAATWFSNPQRSRLADPCAGEGEALARFKARIGGEAETWGVEISYTRAEQARRVIDVVLPASFDLTC
jgi:tRNA1(Val) A37 N6-methylase TrmN6